jgi:hypothetical protein
MPESFNAKELAAIAESVKEAERLEREAEHAARLASELREKRQIQLRQEARLEEISLLLQQVIAELPSELLSCAQKGMRSFATEVTFRIDRLGEPPFDSVVQTEGARALQEYCDRQGLILNLYVSAKYEWGAKGAVDLEISF